MTMPTSQSPTVLEERSSGVLLHISSLPSIYGIGDLGAAARQFAKSLGAARQRVWQVLPINPTLAAAGDSPYFSSSSLAGNALFIDLEGLVKDGLLKPEEVRQDNIPHTDGIDFARARTLKLPLLELAATRFKAAGLSDDFRSFVARQAHWLNDHALFTALQAQLGQSWANWPEPLFRRQSDALRNAEVVHEEAISQEKIYQYLFAKQWQELKDHCHGHGVALFGDMPIYVAYDSVDVWANPNVFQLDSNLQPTRISGVPPDYFSTTGQLWRNPVYDWKALQATDFAWWQQRVAHNLEYYDVLRIDHFRGLVQYWGVPAGAETAIHGEWYSVPTTALFEQLTRALGTMPIVVEDLGTITDDVVAAREHFGYPGMAVLHFAFGNDDLNNPHRLENHAENAVVYLGTHDNDTSAGWLSNEIDDEAKQRLDYALKSDWQQDPVFALIDMLQHSRARLAVVSAQDLLELPSEARMNNPAKPEKNWDWCLSQQQLDELPLKRLGEISEAAGRC